MSHRPRKRFGQNFLRDQAVIERILDAIDPRPGERLVEIGPGQGALTMGLLRRCGELDAIELDRDLLRPLAERCAPYGSLRLHAADALRFDFQQLQTDPRPLRLVGNLPYNISTPLLFHLLAQGNVIRNMHFMLQKEVVDRMAADAGSRTYGRLSVMLQVRCAVIPLFDIAPESFHPPPKVESSLVRLLPLDTPLVSSDELVGFGELVSQAFGQRRKTLRNNLKKHINESKISALGIDPGVRPETLTPVQFVQLFHALDN